MGGHWSCHVGCALLPERRTRWRAPARQCAELRDACIDQAPARNDTCTVPTSKAQFTHEQVSREQLLRLLAAQTESNQLDFKREVEDTKAGRAALAKDVVAMANTDGGWIIFGVADQTWEPMGLAEVTDRTALHRKLEPFFKRDPKFEYAEHEVRLPQWPAPHRLGIMYVPRSRRPIHTIEQKNERNQPVLQENTIYVRRGGASTQADQEYLDRLSERLGAPPSTRLPPHQTSKLVAVGTGLALSAVASLLGLLALSWSRTVARGASTVLARVVPSTAVHQLAATAPEQRPPAKPDLRQPQPVATSDCAGTCCGCATDSSTGRGCRARTGACGCCASGRTCVRGSCYSAIARSTPFMVRLGEVELEHDGGITDLASVHPGALVCFTLNKWGAEESCVTAGEARDGSGAERRLAATADDLLTGGFRVAAYRVVGHEQRRVIFKNGNARPASGLRTEHLCAGVEIPPGGFWGERVRRFVVYLDPAAPDSAHAAPIPSCSSG